MSRIGFGMTAAPVASGGAWPSGGPPTCNRFEGWTKSFRAVQPDVSNLTQLRQIGVEPHAAALPGDGRAPLTPSCCRLQGKCRQPQTPKHDPLVTPFRVLRVFRGEPPIARSRDASGARGWPHPLDFPPGSVSSISDLQWSRLA